jgi:hypothetical protein
MPPPCPIPVILSAAKNLKGKILHFVQTLCIEQKTYNGKHVENKVIALAGGALSSAGF